MQVAIINYNAGNVRSVLFCMERLGVEAVLTDDPAVIQSAEKVIFPGVGEARTTMRHLRETGLDEVIKNLTQPVLGICLGMQLLCEHSEENDTPCLGIIPQRVKRFRSNSPEIKVPHMGWNSLYSVDDTLFGESLQDQFVYFVHSYYAEVGDYTIATTDYIQPFSCALRKDNYWATQFHPEKSGKVGEVISRNFLNMQ